MADDKSKQLNETLSQIEKKFGKGTVMRMGDREVFDIPAIKVSIVLTNDINECSILVLLKLFFRTEKVISIGLSSGEYGGV